MSKNAAGVPVVQLVAQLAAILAARSVEEGAAGQKLAAVLFHLLQSRSRLRNDARLW
ncbi:hypothetical protein [Rhizobium sp. FY34]|uniref:hypothetical protein n=1 Tax=Rhizobium sp. FY34 TaxID=2562309 RepID=UPI001484E6C8|nr:hypothetical protein [Rhizobium sp. FY34]